ncbi:MAG: lamin tail domain-containing protein [Candidatus Chisholmbacteria bacterium]|nr:lamin tail domain-containing protein [Candidatus Chisholmbacteria bacterium]
MRWRHLLISLGIFSVSFTPVFAADTDIVINEVLPNPSDDSSEQNEFIELYNKGSEQVSLTNWTLADQVKTYTIGEITLAAGGFASFKKSDTSIGLNNDGDSIELKNAGGSLIDSMSFGNSSNSEDRSWSRYPDGTGSFFADTTPTENGANSVPPSPSPTPTPTPTPSPSPTPTSTPKPSPTPKPTTSTASAKKSPEPTLEPVAFLDTEPEQKNVQLGETLGESTAASPAATVVAGNQFNRRTIVSWLLTGSGLVFLTAAGFPLLRRHLKAGKIDRWPNSNSGDRVSSGQS